MKKTFAFWLSCFIAGLFTALTVWIAGDHPVHVLKVLFQSAFGSLENITYTLFYATPMLLTGIAVTLALEAGLFNIGAEGQLYMGAVFTCAWAMAARLWIKDSNTSFIIIILTMVGAILSAILGGALWGGLVGYLRSKRNTHEVIASIMLNFVALAFSNWVILNPFKNPETQSLETFWIPEPLRIPRLWIHAPWSLPFVLLLVFTVLWLLRKTWWGFRVRATGQNPNAARIAGIKQHRTLITTMAISGGISGLVGFHEIYCHAYRLLDSFSGGAVGGFGFTGLAVALLSRGSSENQRTPLRIFVRIFFASLFFGALHKGSLDLDLETEKITRDLSTVIQALILIALSAQTPLQRLLKTERS